MFSKLRSVAFTEPASVCRDEHNLSIYMSSSSNVIRASQSCQPERYRLLVYIEQGQN